ncbi:MAG: hypothetical protein ACKODX_14430 [Gemmata sp.]
MKTLLFGFGALALVGCNTAMRPVGPLAKDAPVAQQGQPVTRANSGPPQAVRPTPPTMLVTPGDATAGGAADAAHKLAAELKADSNPAKGPVTVEVSHVKGGIK